MPTPGSIDELLKEFYTKWDHNQLNHIVVSFFFPLQSVMNISHSRREEKSLRHQKEKAGAGGGPWSLSSPWLDNDTNQCRDFVSLIYSHCFGTEDTASTL